MSAILYHSPGSIVTMVYQTLDHEGQRKDGYSLPIIARVILPDLSESTIYPLNMNRLDTGLYLHKFTLPTGLSALGTYIVDISYTDINNNRKNDFFQVVCSQNFDKIEKFSISAG